MRCFVESDGEYTPELIKHVLRSRGVPVEDDPGEADLVLVSLCDITEIPRVVKARQYGKPVVAGGFPHAVPLLNELADYVWHGEVYGFADALAIGLPLEEMDSITTREKRDFTFDGRVDWASNPIVNVGGKASYYLVARGCQMRCRFCMCGYLHQRKQIPEGLYRSAETAVTNAKRSFMPVGAYDPYSPRRKIGIREVLLKQWLRDPVLDCKSIRTGVEFVTPELSRALGKNVQADDVARLVHLTEGTKTKATLYFIAGLETTDEVIDFINKMPRGHKRLPDMRWVFTYLDGVPGTPLYDLDMSSHHVLNPKALKQALSGVNMRFSMSIANTPHLAWFRTFMARVTTVEEYAAIRRNRGEGLLDYVREHLPHLVGSGATVGELQARPRADDYLGKHLVPYWGAAERLEND